MQFLMQQFCNVRFLRLTAYILSYPHTIVNENII